MSAVYRLKKDDPQFGLHAGDLLLCIGYWLDPEKATVLCRVTDGFQPECNQYRTDLERVTEDDLVNAFYTRRVAPQPVGYATLHESTNVLSERSRDVSSLLQSAQMLREHGHSGIRVVALIPVKEGDSQ